MALDEKDWRPITFQGVTFPPTLMGISVLEPILDINDEEIGEWVWRLPICRGVEKSCSAKLCHKCSQVLIDLMLEHRARVIEGIRELLGPHGFDPDTTFRDWIMALQQIRDLSENVEGECYWSAPSHPQDAKAADWQRFLRALDRYRERLTKGGEDESGAN